MQVALYFGLTLELSLVGLLFVVTVTHNRRPELKFSRADSEMHSYGTHNQQ
jgi:hypothetical protein